MSLLDVLRTGVAVANGVTRPLQPRIKYERCVSVDGAGTKTYAGPRFLHAVEEWEAHPVKTSGGVLTVARATLLFLDIPEVKTATAGAGFTDKDKFTLSDGSTGPVLELSGFIDAGTAQPVATTVAIG